MAQKYIKFSRGTSEAFQLLEKDADTVYFLADKREIFLGDNRYALGDINIDIIGTGNVVANVTWDQATTTLVFTLGESADPDQIKEVIYSVLSGNLIETNPLIRYNSETKKVETCLSITTETIEDSQYVVLKGFAGAEISRINASDIVAAGMLKSASTIEKGAKTYLVLIFGTQGGSETRIEIDVSDLVDVYTVSADGRLELIGNQFAIKNYFAEDHSEPLNVDTVLDYGQEYTFNTIKFDKHGLISGTSTFKLEMPELPPSVKPSGEAGDKTGYTKVLKYVGFDNSGKLIGQSIDLIDNMDLVDSETTQILTADAVKQGINEIESKWG